MECGGLTPPLQRKLIAALRKKGGVKPPHSKGFAVTYEAEFLREFCNEGFEPPIVRGLLCRVSG